MDTKPVWASTPIRPTRVTVWVALPESGPLTDARQTSKLGVFHGPNVSIHSGYCLVSVDTDPGNPKAMCCTANRFGGSLSENISGLIDEDLDPEDWIEPFKA